MSFSFRIIAGLGLLSLAAAPVAQAQQADSLPAALSRQFAQYSRRALTEKLYLHLDRPAYAAGETMWLKAYATDGTTHRPLALSRVAYVEVLDAAHKPVAQASLALSRGTGQGSVVLPAGLATGRYLVRAYTSWMQNASPEFYFQSPVVILNTFSPSGTTPAAPKEAPAYDVQFFPEGGQLVQGLPSRVAFKVLDKAGRSVAATGTVANAQGKTVAAFQTLKYGLGSFELTPTEAGAGYVATVRLPGGATASARLPAVQAQGYTLRMQEASLTAFRLTVQAAGPAAEGSPVQLLGHAGQRVLLALSAPLQGGRAEFLVKKRSLPEGISHFTVFEAGRPVAERLYFRPQRHRLAIVARADQPTYAPRTAVALQVATPQAASLSLAVYRLDSLAASAPADIASYLLLTSDLKGAVENPGYYLRDSSAVGREAADNLMLTQGWSRFRWADALAPPAAAPAHRPEVYGPLLQARLTQPDGTPAPVGTGAYLTLPGRTGRFYYASSQAGGLVQFEPAALVGTQKIILQTNLRRDSTYRFELLSPYSTRPSSYPLPPLALGAPLGAALTERHVQVQVQQAFAEATTLAYRALPADTASFFGKPDERYLLDDFTRFKVMEEVMREYVPGVLVRKRRDGFHFNMFNHPRQTNFQDEPLVLVDGMPVFNTNAVMAFDPLKIKELDLLTASYYQDGQTYSGVASFTTYQGDLAGFPISPRALIEEYEGLQGQREFYAPRYDTPTQQQSRLPDLRNLLYWNPNVSTTAGPSQPLSFFTSDQAGRYLVVVQGLAATGQAGSASFTFEVKPAL